MNVAQVKEHLAGVHETKSSTSTIEKHLELIRAGLAHNGFIRKVS